MPRLEEPLRNDDNVIREDWGIEREFERLLLTVDDTKYLWRLGGLLGKSSGHRNGHVEGQTPLVPIVARFLDFSINVESLCRGHDNDIIRQDGSCNPDIYKLDITVVMPFHP